MQRVRWATGEWQSEIITISREAPRHTPCHSACWSVWVLRSLARLPLAPQSNNSWLNFTAWSRVKMIWHFIGKHQVKQQATWGKSNQYNEFIISDHHNAPNATRGSAVDIINIVSQFPTFEYSLQYVVDFTLYSLELSYKEPHHSVIGSFALQSIEPAIFTYSWYAVCLPPLLVITWWWSMWAGHVKWSWVCFLCLICACWWNLWPRLCFLWRSNPPNYQHFHRKTPGIFSCIALMPAHFIGIQW